MKTYIIAGNSLQAKDWLREKEYYTGFAYRPNDFQIVMSVDNLRGIENPSGVFVGTWYKRQDIVDILHVLQSRMRKTNEGLLKAVQVYGEYNERR